MRRFVIALSALAVASTVAPGTAHATYPGYNGKIVFISDRDGNDEIYAMNADGTGQTRLTNTPAAELYPVFSPRGDRIAFASDRDGGAFQLYTMKSDGTEIVREDTTLTGNDLEPYFSNDGTGNLLFANFPADGGEPQTFIKVPGAPLARTASLPPGHNVDAVWNNAGSIAFTSSRDDGDEEIYSGPDGFGATRLTHSPGRDFGPNWSPDGTKIAFSSERDGNAEIYVMDANGDRQTRLTHDPGSDAGVAWSPDGRQLVFASNRDGDDEVYTINADGSGEPTQLTHNNATDFVPDWRPVLYSHDNALGDIDHDDNRFELQFLSGADNGVLMGFESIYPKAPPPSGYRATTPYWDQFFYPSTAHFDLASLCLPADRIAPESRIAAYDNGTWTILPFINGGNGHQTCTFVTSLNAPFVVVDVVGGDTDAPIFACAAADGNWHAANVTLTCTAHDDGSGLADPADATFALSTKVADGAQDADAATDTHRVCDVAGNCVIVGPVLHSKVDRKPPDLTVPADQTLDATLPTGARTALAATSSEGTVSCVPASGTTFAIGTTTVSCTATDQAGNTTTGSFHVIVRGAGDQLARLIADVINSTGLPAPLKTQLISGLQSLVTNLDTAGRAQRQATCLALGVFATAVRVLSGRGVPSARATQWIADTNRVRAVLAC